MNLQDFIQKYKSLADFRGLSDKNPIVFTLRQNNEDFLLVVSHKEVTNAVLPLNVSWIVSDPESADYEKLLRRTSLESSQNYNYSWEELTSPQQIFTQVQYYDATGSLLLGELINGELPKATDEDYGLVRLNIAAENSEESVVCSYSDPRLTDARIPLSHTHQSVPAVEIKNDGGPIYLGNSVVPSTGNVLILQEDGFKAGWRALSWQDIVFEEDQISSLEIEGPVEVNEEEFANFSCYAIYSNGARRLIDSTDLVWSTETGTTITNDGVFYASDTTGDKTVTISAYYTLEDDSIVSTSHSLTVIDTTPAVNPLVNIAISGPNTVNETETGLYRVTAEFSDGTTQDVSSGASWSVSNESVASISDSGLFTALEVIANTTVTIDASYTAGGSTKTDSFAVSIINQAEPEPLQLLINGPTSIDENTTATFTAQVEYTDGTFVDVTPGWMVDDVLTASIDSSGILSANEVTENTSVVITASHLESGNLLSSNKTVTIVDTTVYIDHLEILGPNSINELVVQQFTANAHYTDGSSSDITTSGTWSTSNTSVATIDNTGSLSAKDVLGNQNVTVSIEYSDSGETYNASKTIAIVDTTIYLSSIAIQGNASVDENSTGAFNVEATYSDGSKSDVTDSVSWSLDDTTHGSIDSSGQLTTLEVDTNTDIIINASYEENGTTKTATKTVSIVDTTNYPDSLLISGPSMVSSEGSGQLSAQVRYLDGSTADVTNSCVWISSDESVLTVNTDGSFSTSSVSDDSFVYVRATYTENGREVTVTHNILVEYTEILSVTSIEITGPNFLNEGASEQYSLIANYEDGSSTDITSSVINWNSSNSSTSVNTSGLISVSSLSGDSTTTLEATFNWSDPGYVNSDTDQTVSFTINLIDVYVESIEITGPDTLFELNTGSYVASATFSDGNVQNVICTWTTDSPSESTIDNTSDPLYGILEVLEIPSDGSVVIRAEYVGDSATVSATKTVDIYNVVPTIDLVGSVNVDENTNSNYSLSVSFNDGQSHDFDSISWSTDSSLVDITPAADQMSANLAFNTFQSSTTVVLTVEALWKGTTYTQTLDINVSAITILSFIIEGPESFFENSSADYSAMIYFSDGSSVNETTNVVFNSSDPSVADFSQNTLSSSEVSEDTDVIIDTSYTFKGVPHAATKTVTITDIVVDHITITGNTTVQEEQTSQYQAIAYFNDGTSSVINPTWSTSDTTNTSIDSSGLLTTNNISSTTITTTITASYVFNGVTTTDTLDVVVENNYLSYIEISGISTVNENTTASFTATANYLDGTNRDVTLEVTWSTSDSSVSTIDSSGTVTINEFSDDTQISILASLTEEGTTKNDSHLLYVTDIVVPTSIQIGYDTELNEGSTATYSAIVYYSDGSSGSAVSGLTWSTSDSSIATIDSSGQLTALDVSGDQTVDVLCDYVEDGITLTDSLTVTVKDIVVSSIEISGPVTINEETTVLYSTTATYSDGSTKSVDPVWNISPTIGSINSAGSYSPGSVDSNTSVTVSAEYTENSVTVTDSLVVTVENSVIQPTSLEITGPNTVLENSSYNFTATVTFSDGSTADKTNETVWSLNSGTSYCSIDSVGLLVTAEVSADQTAQISASFTDSVTSVEVNATKDITISNVEILMPSWGTSTAVDITNGAELLSICTNEMPSTNDGEKFTLPDTSATSEYGYFMAPASLGEIEFVSSLGSGGWDGIHYGTNLVDGSISPTYKQIDVNGTTYNVYRTDYTWNSETEYTINYSSN